MHMTLQTLLHSAGGLQGSRIKAHQAGNQCVYIHEVCNVRRYNCTVRLVLHIKLNISNNSVYISNNSIEIDIFLET